MAEKVGHKSCTSREEKKGGRETEKIKGNTKQSMNKIKNNDKTSNLQQYKLFKIIKMIVRIIAIAASGHRHKFIYV